MRTKTYALLLVVSMMAAGVSAAHPFKEWSLQHPEAKSKLLRILELHPRFSDSLCEIAESNPGLLQEYVEFLAEKGDRSTNDFEKKKGREARPVGQLHEKYGEVVRSFREWIRDNKDAAISLVKMKDGMKIMCKGGEVKEEPKAADKRESDKDDKGDRDHPGRGKALGHEKQKDD